MLRRGGEVGKEWTNSLFNGHSGVYSKNTSAREAQTSEAELKNCSSFLVLSPCQCFCQVPWEQPVYESTVRIVRKSTLWIRGLNLTEGWWRPELDSFKRTP